MNDNEKQHARALIDRLIAEAQDDVAQKAYVQALTAIRKAKVLDVTNIYMLALERQVEQLNELTSSGTLTDEQRTDILESLPGIIEQARSTQAPLATPETADAERRSTPEQLEQMRAARQWLKNQYFQRTHEHVKKQEYTRALAELRRVFVIDKDDLFAHEFELKIVQMQELQKQKPPEPAGGPPVSPESVAESPGMSAEIPGATAETSGLSSQESGTPSDEAEEESATSGTVAGKRNRLLPVAVGLAVIVVAFAFYYFWTREQPAGPVALPPADETEQEVSDDEPMYSIPPPLQIDTTKTDSTQTVTPDTAGTTDTTQTVGTPAP